MLMARMPLVICGPAIWQLVEVKDQSAEDAMKISKEGEEN